MKIVYTENALEVIESKLITSKLILYCMQVVKIIEIMKNIWMNLTMSLNYSSIFRLL